ncbi:Metallo-dependent phosphatase [Auricularia subglabra TFB-10046 SS5]|nr:Metallo-dependent phosphatase [Auricularia subglabra TFB-10046 SS5]
MAVPDLLARPLRSWLAPLGTVVLFSTLLAYVFILNQPTVGPGSLQRLGWQSWELVADGAGSQSRPDDLGLPLDEDLSAGSSNHWWDAQASKPGDTAAAELPLDNWNPLLPHSTGLSEIAVSRCMFPPSLVDFCAPKADWSEAFQRGGQWVRVDRDLNTKAGFWWLNIYYRRTRRFDVPLITDIKILPVGGESELEDLSSWKRTSTSLRDGVPGAAKLYLWYKIGPTLQEYHNGNATSNLVTEVDVLYGDGPAWYGFQKLPTPITEGKGKDGPVWLTYRKGPAKPLPRVPPLHFSPERNGAYKILQVADLHFSTGRSACRDVSISPCTNADEMTADLLARVLEEEKPDLVVFTGDQLNGQGTSWDSKSVIAKFAREVIKRRIPWAAIIGNHDDEEDLDRKELMKYISQMPYSVSQVGPEDVDGAGNYVLKIRSSDPSATHLLTLYFLDSHGYIKANYGLFEQITDYDYIRQAQIDWFLTESSKIKPVMRPHKPDGGADLKFDIGPRARVKKPAAPAQTLAKPNALMFYHIPIPETFTAADVDPKTGKPLDIGNQFDSPGGSKKNAGFFEKALLTARESSQGGYEVKVVGNGHHHVTDNCRRVKGVWFCFGGGGSFAGYGRLGYDRRFRVYDITEYGERIRTYKRTEFGKIIDDVVLVGRDAWGTAP